MEDKLLDEMKYAGFVANVYGIPEGLKVVYLDASGKELVTVHYPGITDYQLKTEEIGATLKKFWETEPLLKGAESPTEAPR